MKSNTNYSINGWMLNELNLRGNNLLIFAIIHSFSKDGVSEFRGSLKYLCEATGASKNTVIKSLNELIDLGYIVKASETISGITLNKYSQNEQVVQKLVWGSSETGRGGSSETGTNNNNIDNNNYNVLFKKEPKDEIDEKQKFDYFFELKKHCQNEQVLNDFKEHKKRKKASTSETAFNSLISEIKKSGLSAEEVLKEIITRNWQGFKAEWLKNNNSHGQTNKRNTTHLAVNR